MKIFFKANFVREKPVFSAEVESPDYFQLERINYDPIPVLSSSLLKDILDRFPFIPSLPHHHGALDYNFLQLKLLSGKNFLSRMKRMEEDYFRIKRQEARDHAAAFKILQTEFMREIQIELDTLRIIEAERLKSDFHFKQAFAERRDISKKHLENHLKSLDQAADWFEKKLDELQDEHRTDLKRSLGSVSLRSFEDSFQHSSKTSLISVLDAFPSANATNLGSAFQKIYRYLVLDFDRFQPTQKCLLSKRELHFERPASRKSPFQSEIFDQKFWKNLADFSASSTKPFSGQFSIAGDLKASSGFSIPQSTSSFLELLDKSTSLHLQIMPPNLLKDAKVIAGIRAFSLVKDKDVTAHSSETPIPQQKSSEVPSQHMGFISKIESDPRNDSVLTSGTPRKGNLSYKWGRDGAATGEGSYSRKEDPESLIKRLDDQGSSFANHLQIEELYPSLLTPYGPGTVENKSRKEKTAAQRLGPILENKDKEKPGQAVAEMPSRLKYAPKEGTASEGLSKNSARSLSAYGSTFDNHRNHFYPVMEVKWGLGIAKEAILVREEASMAPLVPYKENQNLSPRRGNPGEARERPITNISNDGKESPRKIAFRKKLGA